MEEESYQSFKGLISSLGYEKICEEEIYCILWHGQQLFSFFFPPILLSSCKIKKRKPMSQSTFNSLMSNKLSIRAWRHLKVITMYEIVFVSWYCIYLNTFSAILNTILKSGLGSLSSVHHVEAWITWLTYIRLAAFCVHSWIFRLTNSEWFLLF